MKIHQILVFFTLMFLSTVAFALPYKIVPKNNVLPTTYSAGTDTIALYTVTNITTMTLSGGHIKYLPKNVVQVTQDNAYYNLCGTTFDLAPGASCTLELRISGMVDSFGSTEHNNYLFVCANGIAACSGTQYEHQLHITPATSASLVSITITPANKIIGGGKQPYTATGNYSDGSTQIMTSSVTWSSSDISHISIDNTGLATTIGSTPSTPISATITATLGDISGNTTLTITKNQMAYISNHKNNTVSICPVNSADGSLGTCTATSGDFTFAAPRGIAINSAHTLAYVANSFDNSISICKINPDGSLQNCTATKNETFNILEGIALNEDNTILYAASLRGHSISICPLDKNGGIATCTKTTNKDKFAGLMNIYFHPNMPVAYVSDLIENNISVCMVNATDGSFNVCTPMIHSLISGPMGIAVNTLNPLLYITNFMSHKVIYCGGDFCSETGSDFHGPAGIALNATNTFAYVTNLLDSNLSICHINATSGVLENCTKTTGNGTFSGPFAVVIV